MQRKRADIVLVDRGFFNSRAKAREAIDAGLVEIDGARLRKAAGLIAGDAAITATKPYPWVSRGGVKLAAALDHFAISPAGLICLDIGASTGGFTHVLHTRGAAQIYAVDVGRDQLAAEVAQLPAVISLEQQDARALAPNSFAAPPQLAVCDLSFISLKLVLPSIWGLLASDAVLVALIKPQFEAGRDRAAKGVVRDPSVHEDICRDIDAFLSGNGWQPRDIIPSPIEGGDGNREFLIAATRGTPTFIEKNG